MLILEALQISVLVSHMSKSSFCPLIKLFFAMSCHVYRLLSDSEDDVKGLFDPPVRKELPMKKEKKGEVCRMQTQKHQLTPYFSLAAVLRYFRLLFY